MKHLPTALSLAAMLAMYGASAIAQTTKDGTQLEWRNELTVVPYTIKVGDKEFPAHTISIFEVDASTALDLWKAEYLPISAKVDGKPMRATSTRLPKLQEAPVTVLAEASSDKKAGLAKLTVAFLADDTTALPEDPAQAAVAHDLAVSLNKAVVQRQIDRYQKELDKVTDKYGGSQEDVAKAKSKVTKTNRSLDKTRSKRAKIEANNARLYGEIAGLEKKFALSNDPKDLKKLTKARSKLANNEKDQAKLLTQEVKLEGSLGKQQNTVESHATKAADHAESKEDLLRIVTALKRKYDKIR